MTRRGRRRGGVSNQATAHPSIPQSIQQQIEQILSMTEPQSVERQHLVNMLSFPLNSSNNQQLNISVLNTIADANVREEMIHLYHLLYDANGIPYLSRGQISYLFDTYYNS